LIRGNKQENPWLQKQKFSVPYGRGTTAAVYVFPSVILRILFLRDMYVVLASPTGGILR